MGYRYCVVCGIRTEAHDDTIPSGFHDIMEAHCTFQRGFAKGYLVASECQLKRRQRMRDSEVLDRLPFVNLPRVVEHPGSGEPMSEWISAIVTGESGIGKTTAAVALLQSVRDMHPPNPTASPDDLSASWYGMFFSGSRHAHSMKEKRRTDVDAEEVSLIRGLTAVGKELSELERDLSMDGIFTFMNGWAKESVAQFVRCAVKVQLQHADYVLRRHGLERDASRQPFRLVLVFDDMGDYQHVVRGLLTGYIEIQAALKPLGILDIKLVVVGTGLRLPSRPYPTRWGVLHVRPAAGFGEQLLKTLVNTTPIKCHDSFVAAIAEFLNQPSGQVMMSNARLGSLFLRVMLDCCPKPASYDGTPPYNADQWLTWAVPRASADAMQSYVRRCCLQRKSPEALAALQRDALCLVEQPAEGKPDGRLSEGRILGLLKCGIISEQFAPSGVATMAPPPCYSVTDAMRYMLLRRWGKDPFTVSCDMEGL